MAQQQPIPTWALLRDMKPGDIAKCTTRNYTVAMNNAYQIHFQPSGNRLDWNQSVRELEWEMQTPTIKAANFWEAFQAFQAGKRVRYTHGERTSIWYKKGQANLVVTDTQIADGAWEIEV